MGNELEFSQHGANTERKHIMLLLVLRLYRSETEGQEWRFQIGSCTFLDSNLTWEMFSIVVV